MSHRESHKSLLQIVGEYSPGQIWALATVICVSFGSVASAAYWIGSHFAGVVAQEKINTKVAENGALKANVQSLEKENTFLRESLANYKQALSTSRQSVHNQEAVIDTLRQELVALRPCEYLKDQITALEERMQSIHDGTKFRSGIFSYGGSRDEAERREAKRNAEDQAELRLLQDRVMQYTAQLAQCNGRR